MRLECQYSHSSLVRSLYDLAATRNRSNCSFTLIRFRLCGFGCVRGGSFLFGYFALFGFAFVFGTLFLLAFFAGHFLSRFGRTARASAAAAGSAALHFAADAASIEFESGVFFVLQEIESVCGVADCLAVAFGAVRQAVGARRLSQSQSHHCKRSESKTQHHTNTCNVLIISHVTSIISWKEWSRVGIIQPIMAMRTSSICSTLFRPK
jgi:hypothetical protein